MQDHPHQFATTRAGAWSLGGTHGYRVEGDTAILNAELALRDTHDGLRDAADEACAQHWALQLWACERPYQGGPLQGIKVAEAELALSAEPAQTTHMETAAFARLPPTQGEYAMVLVLASGDRGRYEQVHDFSNYAARQQFAGPRLDGSVGYRFEAQDVVLQAERVSNSRGLDNLSGTLVLEFWALEQPYRGGALGGQLLAQASLGRLEGQAEQRFVEQRVARTDPPPGTWSLALVLREWTCAAGYVVRDYCSFAAPHVVSAANPTREESTAPARVAVARAEETRPFVEPTPAKASPADAAEPERASAPMLAAAPAIARPLAQAAAAAAKKPAPNALKSVAPSSAHGSDRARVSVQTASVEELASVDGLNRKLAQAIVKARPFRALEDVVKVRGIGDKLLQRLRGQLTF